MAGAASIVHLAAETRLSASASSCESVCLQSVRSILRNRRIDRYVGHDHVLHIGVLLHQWRPWAQNGYLHKEKSALQR